MSVERRILPIPLRRRSQRAASNTNCNMPLIFSTSSLTTGEDEDIRLSFDHAGNWTGTANRKIRSLPQRSRRLGKPAEKHFASVGIQHDGLQLPPSRRSARVGYGRTDYRSSYLADLFEGQGFHSFDFQANDWGIGQVTSPVRPSYKHAETQTPSDNLPQAQIPQWTYSKRRVRFVNRSRRRYMQEKRKVNKVNVRKDEEIEKDEWICPFCDYEDIYKEPPYALISQYEMREKDEWRRSALQQASRHGNGSEIHVFGKSYRVFPDNYYEWESRPPDQEGLQCLEQHASDNFSCGHDCYDYGG